MSENPVADVLSGLRVCKVTGAYVGVDGGDTWHCGSLWKRPDTREC